MARYREKDEADLIWNRIRRRLTREFDTELQNAREEALNKLLAHAWDEFVKAMQSGEVKELESRYTKLVHEVVADLLPGDGATEVVDEPAVG